MFSPAEIDSALRIMALTGRRKQPDFLSGNIEVFHVELPMMTLTGKEPNPLGGPLRSRSSPLRFSGTVMKYQEAEL